jgi:hypothetical protein
VQESISISRFCDSAREKNKNKTGRKKKHKTGEQESLTVRSNFFTYSQLFSFKIFFSPLSCFVPACKNLYPYPDSATQQGKKTKTKQEGKKTQNRRAGKFDCKV